jgi:hypothetical protein
MDTLSFSFSLSENCQLTTDNFRRRHTPRSAAAANKIVFG